MTHGLFLVSGRRQYRGHRPGERFEARIEPALARAMDRGDIRLLEMVEPEVPPGYRLPDDWPPSGADVGNTEAAKAASLISEGGKTK